MAHLLTVLLERNPTEDIKRRAYNRLVDTYEKEVDTGYYFYQFQDLFAELIHMLPENILKRIEAANPDMWGKFKIVLSGNCPREKIDFTETQSLGGILIPPECDYSVYAYYCEASLNYYCIGFYPNGKAISLNVSAIKAPHRFEPRKWFELINSAMEWRYSLCSDKQADVTKQTNKITVTIWGIRYTGWFNQSRELVLTTTVDGKELNYVYKYMGYVTGNQFSFG